MDLLQHVEIYPIPMDNELAINNGSVQFESVKLKPFKKIEM